MWQVIFSMPDFAVKAAERVPGNLTNCFELNALPPSIYGVK